MIYKIFLFKVFYYYYGFVDVNVFPNMSQCFVIYNDMSHVWKNKIMC